MSTFAGFDRPLNKYKVSELKNFLRSRSLKVGGLKRELVKRLRDALQAEAQAQEQEQQEQREQQEQQEKRDADAATSSVSETKGDAANSEDESKPQQSGDGNDKTSKDTLVDASKPNGDVAKPSADLEPEPSKVSVADKAEADAVSSSPSPKPTKSSTSMARSKGDDGSASSSTSKPDSIARECVSIPNKHNKHSSDTTEDAEPAPATKPTTTPTTTPKQDQPNSNTNDSKAPVVPSKTEPDPEPEPDPDPANTAETDRAKSLADMRARLLREKLLKQQKANSSSPTAAAPETPATTTTATTTNSKKRTRDFDNPSRETKRAKVDSPRTVITSPKSSTSGARIVVTRQQLDDLAPDKPKPSAQPSQMDSMDLNDTSHAIDKDTSTDGVTGCALRIDGFRRPLQTRKVEEALREFGNFRAFRMNAIKSHCFVVYDDSTNAAKCKKGLDGVHFPRNIPTMHAGKLSVSECGMVEAMLFIEGRGQPRTQPQRGSPRGRGARYSFETRSVREGKDGKVALKVRVDVTSKRTGKAKAEVEVVKKVRVKAKTPRSLFKMTKCKPFVFYQPSDEDERKVNAALLEEMRSEEVQMMKAIKAQRVSVSPSRSKSKSRSRSPRRERRRGRSASRSRSPPRRDRDRRRERDVRDSRDLRQRERVRDRGHRERERVHPERRGRVDRDRDRGRERRGRRYRSRERSEERGGGYGRHEKVPTTTLDSSKESSLSMGMVHPERMNRIS